MPWSDRDQSRDSGSSGVWSNINRVLGRTFGGVDNVLNWSLPLYTLWGIAVRVHLFYIAWMLFRLIGSAFGERLGPVDTLISMGALFVLVLLHEYGHCLACRWRGGEADRILMWPLGGLASCSPPDTWQDNFITTAGGPAVNLLLMPALGGAVLFTSGSWGAVFFNPLDLGGAIITLDTWTQRTLFWIHVMNAFLFAFNVFLPMFPMDGGRLMQCLLWAKLGKERSMSIAVNVGLCTAILVALFAITVPDTWVLFGIAAFGGIICWQERQRLKFAAEAGGLYGGPTDDAWKASLRDNDAEPSHAERAASKASAKRADADAKAQDEIDRILAKISESGLPSLTRAEKKTLERASKASDSA